MPKRKPARKPQANPPNFKIKLNGGVAYFAESELQDNQCAPGTVNVWHDGKRITSRPGLAYLFANSLGVGQINGFMDFRKRDGTVITLVHWGTGLYTQSGANQPVLLYNGLANAKSSGYAFDDVAFIGDGTNLVYWDGTNPVADVGSAAYIPVLIWNKKPDGTGGSIKERLNRFADSWYEQFTSDGTADYSITGGDTITSIDEVSVAGVVKTVGVDYSADAANRKFTFLAGHIPIDVTTTTTTNNVQVKVTKTGAQDPTVVEKCTFFIVYENRVVAGGNPSDPHAVYWTGILTTDIDKMAFYWPDDGRHAFEGPGVVTGAIPHDSSLLVFKSLSTHRMDPSTTAQFDFDFHVVDYSWGCDMPGTIRLVNGYALFGCSYKGISLVESAIAVRNQRNFRVISGNINGSEAAAGLLDEQDTDLANASSFDDGRRYGVCVKDKVWVIDYINTPLASKPESLAWWPWQGINAGCFITRGKDVYFGDRTNGTIGKLMPGALNDFGQPISRDVKLKKLNFGYPEEEKYIPDMWLTQQSNIYSETSITYYSDTDTWTDDNAVVTVKGFDLDNIDYDNVNYDAEMNNHTTHLMPVATNTVEFGVEFTNNNLNQDLSIVQIAFGVQLTNEVI